jgi:hypothetical protein
MVGDINIHSKLIEEGDEHIYLRTSDYRQGKAMPTNQFVS